MSQGGYNEFQQPNQGYIQQQPYGNQGYPPSQGQYPPQMQQQQQEPKKKNCGQSCMECCCCCLVGCCLFELVKDMCCCFCEDEIL